MLGSIDYNNASIDGQFDVTQAYRQPGSSFKPYVYVTAFQQGASPAQAIDDQPITIPVPDSNPSTFTPTNYDNKFHGHMTLRCALQNSLNVPGVKVLQHAGIDASMQRYYLGAAVMINANEDSGAIARVVDLVAREYRWPDYQPAGKN